MDAMHRSGEIQIPRPRLHQPGAEADRFEIVPLAALDPADRRTWESLRALHPDYRSPFFSTAFADAVQRARGDVLVAIARSGEEPVGYLPFHRIGRTAVPVGRSFNDAQNVISDPEYNVDWFGLLRAARVKSFDFHALAGVMPRTFEFDQQGTVGSYCAEFRGDSRAFLEKLRKTHKSIRRQPQKTRKMEREVGPVTAELDCRDPHLLEQTIDWKSRHYRRTNILDLFVAPWTRKLLSELHRIAPPNVPMCGRSPARGLLSVLRAGDRVVAAHFGIVEDGLLHYWFPTYDTNYAKYSPGTALFCELVRMSTDHGVDCIDMGYGEQNYKLKQTDVVSRVRHGCITPSTLHRRWTRVTKATESVLKRVPMKASLKHVLRRVQPHAGISKLK